MVVRILAWAGLIGIALAWATFLRPTSLGGPVSYVIVSGNSMEPTYSDGDLAVLKERASYAVGDVVAYRVATTNGRGALVIHRIIGVENGAFLTQGDNRDGRDQWRPTERDMIGTPMVAIPLLGRALRTVATPAGMAALSGIGAFFAVLRSPRAPVPSAPAASAPAQPDPTTRAAAAAPAPAEASAKPTGTGTRSRSVRMGSIPKKPARASTTARTTRARQTPARPKKATATRGTRSTS